MEGTMEEDRAAPFDHLARAKAELDKSSLTAEQASTHALIAIAHAAVAVAERLERIAAYVGPLSK